MGSCTQQSQGSDGMRTQGRITRRRLERRRLALTISVLTLLNRSERDESGAKPASRVAFVAHTARAVAYPQQGHDLEMGRVPGG